MTTGRSLTPAERRTLSEKLARMAAAVERKSTARRLAQVGRDARAELPTIPPPRADGRYSVVGR